jgi:tubulin-specific chaperone C
MKNCQIFLGPCCTSVYLEECSDTTIFLSCHQLRIHRSHGCKLYVRVNSHPIIEDCSGFGFAPYSVSYTDIEQDFKVENIVRIHGSIVYAWVYCVC